VSSSDPWGDQGGGFIPSESAAGDTPDPYGSLGGDSVRRRRRQKTKRLLLFIGIPVLAFILISEGVNLLQRNNSFRQPFAGEVVEQVIRQGPEILDAINDGDDPVTGTPPVAGTPAPAAPTPDPAGSFAALDASVPPVDLPGLIALVLPSIVLVECQVSDDEWSQGSGFALNVSILISAVGPVIVSNWHVFENCLSSDEVFLTTSAGVEYQATVVVSDEESDLALLMAPGIDLPALQLSTVFEQGDWVMAAGNPQGVTGTTTQGTVANYKADIEKIFSDVLIAPGSSGGPLLNSRGEVIGVTTWTLIESSGFSISRPIKSLCMLLLDCR
jgi:S1-C subfamily serine protease